MGSRTKDQRELQRFAEQLGFEVSDDLTMGGHARLLLNGELVGVLPSGKLGGNKKRNYEALLKRLYRAHTQPAHT